MQLFTFAKGLDIKKKKKNPGENDKYYKLLVKIISTVTFLRKVVPEHGLGMLLKC